MNYVPPIPLETWQIVLAPILGACALATAGLPLLFWWQRRSSSSPSTAPRAERRDARDSAPTRVDESIDRVSTRP